MKNEDTIQSFSGEYEFLSNFYPCQIEYKGFVFPSVENAFQAAKCIELRGMEEFIYLSPSQAKKLGGKVKIRADWDDVRLKVMESFIKQKFCQGDLRKKLLDTGTRELVEGNDWNDTFWGVCNGVGENHLGKILMKIREESGFKVLPL